MGIPSSGVGVSKGNPPPLGHQPAIHPPGWKSELSIFLEGVSSEPELPHPEINIYIDLYPKHIPTTSNQHLPARRPDKAQHLQLPSERWRGMAARGVSSEQHHVAQPGGVAVGPVRAEVLNVTASTHFPGG